QKQTNVELFLCQVMRWYTLQSACRRNYDREMGSDHPIIFFRLVAPRCGARVVAKVDEDITMTQQPNADHDQAGELWNLDWPHGVTAVQFAQIGA
ncbi:MAG: hypothetical protein O7E52_16040, partial [Candidatus Poribacteria bacterium]|nr:hypothetical protein [Candidatus Poribacteria bacterium]